MNESLGAHFERLYRKSSALTPIVNHDLQYEKIRDLCCTKIGQFVQTEKHSFEYFDMNGINHTLFQEK